MGQAKIRKKNRTYPTAAQIAELEEERIRWNTKVWYPSANDLPLLNVPEDARPALRKRIDPWLRRMVHCLSIQDDSFDERLGIRGGECWAVAQSFVMAAKDPNVTLVEGVWTRPSELDEGQQPTPHTWAMVDGYRVDLIGEFYCWRDDCEWLYEPLAEYTYADLLKLFGMGPGEDGIIPEGFDISTYLWEQNGGWESLPEHLTKDIPYTRMPNGLYGTPEEHAADDKQSKERNEYENNIVFKPAVDRLIARYTASQKLQVAA